MYGDWYAGANGDGIHSFETDLEIPMSVQNNGSFYIHAYLVRNGDLPNPKADKSLYSKKYTVHQQKRLNKFKKRSYSRTINLLTGTTTASDEDVLVTGLTYEMQIIVYAI